MLEDTFIFKNGKIIGMRNLGKIIKAPKIVKDIAECNTGDLKAAFKDEYNINKKIEKIDMTPLEIALYLEEFESIKLLVSQGADLNNKKRPSFLIAVLYCDKKIMRYLAENGADIHAVSEVEVDAFQEALYRERYDKLSIIDELGHTAKIYGGSAFHSAVSSNKMEAVEIFIRLGVDINYDEPDIIYTYNETPICVAARQGNLDMVKYLLEHGADVTIPDKTGMRPYNYAIEQGNYKMAEYIKSFEPAELHDLQNKLRDLKTYKLPEALLTFLQGDTLRMELGKDYTIEHIEFFSLVDTIEMKVGRRKLLKISKETGDYPDLIIVWNPKAQCVAYYDTEHEEFGNIAPFEEFMQHAGEYMERVLNGEYSI